MIHKISKYFNYYFGSRSELYHKFINQVSKHILLQRITRILPGKINSTYREVIINAELLETSVAITDDGVLEEFEVERSVVQSGSIFKGRIQNLENGLKAAFVDIGQSKNAFLHYWDIINDNPFSKKENLSIQDITQLIPLGKDIVVQISKGTIGNKGPRITTNLTITGRFLVLFPYGGYCGISLKIKNKEERELLKNILNSLPIPCGMGVLVRTTGQGVTLCSFIRDLHTLLKKWKFINHKMQRQEAPCILYQESDIIERTLLYSIADKVSSIFIDNEEHYENILKIVKKNSPYLCSKVTIFYEEISIFEHFKISRKIEETFQRCVPLTSGGSIIIEETEALAAIDVNTSSHKGSNQDYILQANLEAATEATRQIRLRNIGGLIILDFIDMISEKDKLLVYEHILEKVSSDRAKTYIIPINQLGIMQITRQRQRESHASVIYTKCTNCGGSGTVKSSRTVYLNIHSKVVSIIRNLRSPHKLYFKILLNPKTLESIRNEDYTTLIGIERSYNVKLYFHAYPYYHIEDFKIVDA